MSSLIQWPSAKYWTHQWNPIIGCIPCSPACQNCYAAAWAKRFKQSFKPHATRQEPPSKRRGVIAFCGNMTDLFGEWVYNPGYFIKRCIDWRSDARYLWLTKRVDIMCNALEEFESLTTFQHYFGFTAENQEQYNDRLDTWDSEGPYWAQGWLSAEPLLGPIDLGLQNIPSGCMPFKWVVVGCESGPNRRPCKIEWVESIVKQCMKAKIPVFVKQLDIGGRCVTDINKFPAHLRVRQVPWTEEEE